MFAAFKSMGTRMGAALTGAVMLSLASSNAQAVVIDFGGLPAPSVYAGHMEDGFAVTPSAGWGVSQFAGNPVPSIAAFAQNTSLSVTRVGSGLFTFHSLDLGTANNGVGSYDVILKGLRDGMELYS